MHERPAEARAARLLDDEQILEQAVEAGAPDAPAVAQLDHAARRRDRVGCADQELGVAIVEQPLDAGQERVVRRPALTEVISEGHHEAGDGVRVAVFG